MSVVMAKHYARSALLMQYFLMGFIFSSILSRYPAVREIYGMSMAELSFVPFCMSVGSLCIMPVCGHLLGKYGCKKLSAVGYIYMSMFPFIGVMPNMVVLYLFCVFYGMFVSLTDVSVNGNSIILENAYKRPIISMFHALFYVGMCVGAMLGVAFISFRISVVCHLAVISLFSLTSFYYIRSFFLKETPLRTNKGSGFKVMLPKGALLLIAFIALTGRIIEGSISNWSTVYMKTVVDFSENLAPMGLAIYSAFMAFGRFWGDAVRRRFRESAILLGCCMFAMAGILVMISGTEFYFAFIGLFVSGLGMSCLVPIIYSLAGRQQGVTPGMGIAMVNTISGTGFLFGPFVIGLIADAYGMRVSFLYVLTLVCVMTLLVVVFRTRER